MKRRRRLRGARRAGIGVETSEITEPRLQRIVTTETTHQFSPLPAQSPLPLSHPPCIGRAGREPVGDRAVDIMQCNPRDGRWSGRRRSMPSDGSRDPSFLTNGHCAYPVGLGCPRSGAGPRPTGKRDTGSMADLIPYSAPKAKLVHTELPSVPAVPAILFLSMRIEPKRKERNKKTVY